MIDEMKISQVIKFWKPKKLFQIYSSEMDQSRQPLFVYKLPPEADDILYCDKLSFAASTRRESSSVSVLANQLGEIADEAQAVSTI